MTRTEAAAQIAMAIAAADYETSAWHPEGDRGPVRVYVTIPAASRKKKARKIGFVSVESDGSIASYLEVQAGTIMALIPDMAVAPRPGPVVVAKVVDTPIVDEDVEQFERSDRATAARESAREIG